MPENGTTKLDITSWVSVRAIIAAAGIIIALAAQGVAVLLGQHDIKVEMDGLRRDVRASLRIVANSVATATDDRHTGSAAIATWDEFRQLNPELKTPDVRKHQKENPPKAREIYIPMLDD